MTGAVERFLSDKDRINKFLDNLTKSAKNAITPCSN